jgi:hypothetical protein
MERKNYPQKNKFHNNKAEKNSKAKRRYGFNSGNELKNKQ